MMTLDRVGNHEVMVYAQLGQQPLARTTVTSLERSSGPLSCLSARPPDLTFWTGTRPQVVTVSPSIVPFLYSKRTAWTGGLVSRYARSIVLWPFRAYQPWNYPAVVRISRARQARAPRPGPGAAALLAPYLCLIGKA